MVDPVGDLPDERAEQIAAWIMVAVNTCAGFKAVVTPLRPDQKVKDG